MYWPLGAPRIYAATGSRTGRAGNKNGEKDQEEATEKDASTLLGIRVSRNGHLFATVSATTLMIWQTMPIVILASYTRSHHSLNSFGQNVTVMLRPDGTIAVVRTTLGFLITFTITIDPNAKVYQLTRANGQNTRQSSVDRTAIQKEQEGFPEIDLRFRMVIKIDAGIRKVLALDEEIVVATEKPAAVQCIRWPSDIAGSLTNTELLNRMSWLVKNTVITDMVFDKSMNLAIWITNDGKAYAVQKVSVWSKEPDSSRRLFRGYGFHTANEEQLFAHTAAINARFSLLAVGCVNSEIWIYLARDYVGSIPLSYKIESTVTFSTSGRITFLNYSPDGYDLFVGYEKGWAMWSVYGKAGASSFTADIGISKKNTEDWLLGVRDGCWFNGGSNIFLLGRGSNCIWGLDMARSAVTSCYCASNVSRTLLMTASELMLYRGHDLPVTMAITADPTLWHHIQIPLQYMTKQWPIRCAVVSSDGRYVAVAGRHGLAHYSVSSGRWKTFDDAEAEGAFTVRGGMCWYRYILIATVESRGFQELRLYSRELGLDDKSLVCIQNLPAPAVVISLTGEDSLLVYTHENILYHFVITTTASAVSLIQVGQIALHGIVRAPLRVRGVDWILPEFQRRDGDPSQDVAHASIIFLVDAKLVLLQSATSEDSKLKYDMRIIANNVEYFELNEGCSSTPNALEQSLPETIITEGQASKRSSFPRPKDSLWFFDGHDIHCWPEVDDLLLAASSENVSELPQPVTVPVDFYPTSIMLEKAIVFGIDPELFQRRDVQFALFRLSTRTQLFLPPILHRHIAQYDVQAALNVCRPYEQLPYFSHALEVLLHTVLDNEVDALPSPEEALLPSVLSFLSSFPEYLDILVQCTRKTELQSWRTLFNYLPPPQELFEESLQKGQLKTAGGYLLVLHTFEELESSSEQCIRLMRLAKDAGEWGLCKELARFLMALDDSGDSLRYALENINIMSDNRIKNTMPEVKAEQKTSPAENAHHRFVPNGPRKVSIGTTSAGGRTSRSAPTFRTKSESSQGYFNLRN